MKLKLLSMFLMIGLLLSNGVQAAPSSAAKDSGTAAAAATLAKALVCTPLKKFVPTPTNPNNSCLKACYQGTTNVTDIGPCISLLDRNQDIPGVSNVMGAIRSACNSYFNPLCNRAACVNPSVHDLCGTVCCNIAGAEDGIPKCLKASGSNNTCAGFKQDSSSAPRLTLSSKDAPKVKGKSDENGEIAPW